MRNLKRALSLALASVMLLGMMVVGTSAASYPDVSGEDNVEAIEVLNAVKVMVGDRGNFRPDDGVNRHEMAVIMAKLVLGNEAADNYVGSHPFTDVYPWADKYVAACYENNLISGTSSTTYGGNQPLKAVEAALMMLRALGYEDLNKGADDWRAPVTATANRIRLFSGVVSNPNAQLTRNQVAQLTLNTLKSTMVDLTDGTFDITTSVGDATTTVIGGQREYTVRASADARVARAISSVEEKGNGADGKGGWTLELGEHLYNGELKLYDNRSDDFERPARQWEYKGETIGTYAKDEFLRATYTKKVTYQDLYELLGSSVVKGIGKDWNLTVAIDGVTDDTTNPAVFDAGDLTKTNKNTAGATGNGTLTQVYVDSVEKEVTVSIINTYLAKATADYDTKKEYVSLDVYGVDQKSDGSFVKAVGDDAKDDDVKAYAEDFVLAESAKDGDFFLVTLADGSVQSIAAARTVDEVTLDSFKKGSNVVADSTTYDYSAAARYKDTVLDDYASANLKDTVYKLYLDQYGYLIGIEIVEAKDNYVFISGYERYNGVLSNAETEANAIFLDGTNKLITVKKAGEVKKANNSGWTALGEHNLNQWYTYSVDKNDKYSLTAVTGTVPTTANKIKTAQFQDTTANREINKSHVSLKNAAGTNYAYGNEDTVYLNVNHKVIGAGDQITSVKARVVGVKNANMKTVTGAEPQGAYALYNNKGYIIAAVVVGQNLAASENYAFYLGGVSRESYDRTKDEWTWERSAIINGEKVTLRERSDSDDLDYIGDDHAARTWWQVDYDADNYVMGSTAIDFKPDPDSVDDIAVDGVAVFNNDTTLAPIEKDDVALVKQDMDKGTNKLTLDGLTLYIAAVTADTGIQLAPEAKAVLIEKVNGSWADPEYYDASEGNVKRAIKDMRSTGGDYNGELYAVVKDGVAEAIIIVDTDNHTDEGVVELNTNIQIIDTDWKNGFANVLYRIEDSTVNATPADLRTALANALKDLGGRNIEWQSDGKLKWTNPNGDVETTADSPIDTSSTCKAIRVYKTTVVDGKYNKSYVYYTAKDGSDVYAVTAEGNVNGSVAIDLQNAKVTEGDGKYKGDGTGFVDDHTTKGTFVYTAYGSNSDYKVACTHDFTIKTNHVKVTNGVPAYAEYNKAYTIAAGKVSGDGTGYTWTVTGGDPAAYQAYDRALTIAADKVTNDISIAKDQIQVTYRGYVTEATNKTETKAYNASITVPNKAATDKGAGAKITGITGTGYKTYNQAVTASGEDVTIEAGYVEIKVVPGATKDNAWSVIATPADGGSATAAVTKDTAATGKTTCAKAETGVSVTVTGAGCKLTTAGLTSNLSAEALAENGTKTITTENADITITVIDS